MTTRRRESEGGEAELRANGETEVFQYGGLSVEKTQDQRRKDQDS